MNKTLLPKLRFPEFQDVPAWEEKTVGDIAVSESSGLALNKLELKSNGYAVYGADSIVGYIDDFQQNEKYISLVKDGSGVGRLNLCQSHTSILGTLTYLKSKEKKQYDLIWLYYLLNTVDFSRFVKGSGIPHIYYSDFKNEIVFVPSTAEQQKIADCLTALDDLIAAQSQKVESLKAYKKGLMQNLFPAEGESVPRLRFPEFESAGEWEVNEIGAFAKVITGDKDTQNKVDDGKYPFFLRSQNVERINSYSYDGEAILTSGDGVGVGKNFHYIVGKFDFHQRVYCICDFDDTVCGKFVYFYFSEHFYKRAMQMNAKNSVDSVRMAMITEMQILLPRLREQQRIAELLSAVDEEITAQGEAVAALKVHKRGLMQGLFV